jgi:hypothetical protein
MYLLREMNVGPLLALLVVWGIAGWLMAARLYVLPSRERGLVGLGIGMTASTWAVNFLARWLPFELACWLSAGGALVMGGVLAYPLRRRLRSLVSMHWGRWMAFLGIGLLTTLIGRGLAIFDDYQNLPYLSRIAAGDIPPHFPFAQDVGLGYHYFLLLLAAQVMHVARAAPWVALDVARGLTLSLTLLLIGLVARRLTEHPLAEAVAVLFGALAGGARWLLLLLPPSLLGRVSDSIQMIGSGAASGASLSEALAGSWAIEGGGPVPFPFAYASGVAQPLILALSGTGVAAVMVILLLLLTGDQRSSRGAWLLHAILLASLALLHEPAFVLVCAGMGIVLLWRIVRARALRGVGAWAGSLVLAGLLAVLQGGMFTELARGLASSSSGAGSYYDVGFRFVWPPRIVSSHLGDLSLSNPLQLLAALAEVGPLLLVLPLAIVRGREALIERKWMEAGLILSGMLSLGMVFVQYEGIAGPTATTRLYGVSFVICRAYAIPLMWRYTSGRPQAFQALALLLGSVAVLSGAVVFSVQVHAASRPVPSYYLDELDAQMYQRHWDSLPPEAMVFDIDPYRAVSLFGRCIDSSLTLYVLDPAFVELAEDPDPYRLQDAGYDYLYLDRGYGWSHRDVLNQACVQTLDQVEDIHQATGEVGDFRRLLDIRQCR